ncbi:DNA-binding transcriptional LysR family regulator [Burkholderia sp. 572]
MLTIVPKRVAEFRRRNPGIAVTLSDLSSSEQTRRLHAGKLDAGFLRLPADEGLSSFKVVDEGLALAVPPHLGFKRVPADLDVLNEIGFIALQRARGPGLAAQIDRWCVERRFVPHVTQQAEDVQSVLTSVAAGVGVAFIPSRAQYLLRDATVLPLDGRDAKWSVGLAWRSDRDDPVTTRFVSFMRAAIKDA